MCGIAGFIDTSSKLSKSDLERMTAILHHRGPDDSGHMVEQVRNATIGFGHRRLSIIDVSTGGHQPMSDNGTSIVFNGEIYNYQEIRGELQSLGFSFSSKSDTEVILKAFQAWGIESVHRFIGMFAFALFDASKGKVYLVRDRAGVKPLYYRSSPDGIIFASELKAIHEAGSFKKELDVNSLAQYFLYGYILAPHTIFKSIAKLPQGHYLEYSLDSGRHTITKYWDATDSYLKPKLKISESDAIEETERLLKSAFEYRMVSDVPVGVFLSGGYDSTAVTALLQKDRTEKLKTFTIGFKLKGYNEAEYAKQTADFLGTDHTELYCSEKEAEEILPQLPHFYDEPFGDSSAIPTILVSRMAREKVTVALSADGGDELFGGYNKYTAALGALKKLNWVPKFIHAPLGSALNLVPLEHTPLLNRMYRFGHFSRSVGDLYRHGLSSDQIVRYSSHHLNWREVRKLFLLPVTENESYFSLGKNLGFKNHLDSIMAMDYKTYMVDDILVKVDRATMSVSLEGREPFLDHRILEFVARLPAEYKIKGQVKKYLLKKITHKYVPEKMMDRPKTGFAIPVEHWFKKDLRHVFDYYLDPERIRKQDLFDVKTLEIIKNKYLSGSFEDFEFIWSMIVFQMWYDRWM